MAGVTCIYCRADNEPGEQLCRACFRMLPTAAGAAVAADPAADPVAADPAAADPAADPAAELGMTPYRTEEAPTTCPHCGEDVPDPRNEVCVECHRPLIPAEPLRLTFSGGAVHVQTAQTVALGRDPATSPVAGVFADRGNISRLHATVGVDAEGPWVRDERSLNGTYVNDIPVPPATRISLHNGDTLRLAADVTATVQITSPERR